MAALIQITEHGLYCEVGDFYIDPWRPVDRAIVTHAHGDHARPGSRAYLTAAPGAALLRERLGAEAVIQAVPYGSPVSMNGATVSLHPAGHVLGSAQVCVEHKGEVWVVSGDFKTEPEPTCTPLEPLRCQTFITEATYGLPVYRWRPQAEIVTEIQEWWRGNQALGQTSILFAYAIGKAQRLLSSLDPALGPILVHGSIQRFLAAYEAAGVRLPAVAHADPISAKATHGQALVLAPPSVIGSPWLRKFAPYSTAFASGWMIIRGIRRRRNVDRGFALSDHADWDGLLSVIRATGAERIGVTHGYTQVLTRWLTEQGAQAFSLATPFEGERSELQPGSEEASLSAPTPALPGEASEHR